MQHIKTNTYLKSLNDRQLEAVTTHCGPLLVLAGAGTGKTKVLTTRIIDLIESNVAYPNQIMAVTFTNKAAKEMTERIHQILPAEGLWLGTFHAISARVLRRNADIFNLSPNYTILSLDDQIRLIKNILKEENIDDKKYPAKVICNIIQRWKDLALEYDNLSTSNLPTSIHHIAKNIYLIYQQRLNLLDAVDFGDLLNYNIKLFTKSHDILRNYQERFKYILVDEYQDTNVAQYMWLRLLAGNHKNICCVGDEDQSIYRWRGAEIGNILKFEQDFSDAKIIRLEQNYRSTNHILNAASSLISNNNQRLGKKLWSASGDGEKVTVMTLWDDVEEAKFIVKRTEQYKSIGITSNQIAILVRAGFQTRVLEEYFINSSIPYIMIGGQKFYDRLEIKDVLSYIRVTVNPGDSLALERIINTPKRGIGQTTIGTISKYALKYKISMFKAIEDMINNDAFTTRTANSLIRLLEQFKNWRALINEISLTELTEKIIEESGYLKMWLSEISLESESRVENIKELLFSLKDYRDVFVFLEHVSLVADNDNIDINNSVNIMTIHAAKGLEFDAVFSTGWEEGIFPHQKSLDEEGEDGLEEERRLAYVAITRAKKHFTITKTLSRKIFGQWKSSLPSRFIAELPKENIIELEISGNNVSFARRNFRQQNKKNIISKYNRFKIGDRVKHCKFGQGYILSLYDNQIEVSFDTGNVKKILENFISKIN